MNGLNHSAAIHIPLALAVLFPLSYVVVCTLVRIDFLPRRTWTLLWGMVAIQLVTLGLSYSTGRRDLVLSSAPQDLLIQHEDLAVWFIMVWAGVFVVVPLAFLILWRKLALILHGLLLALVCTQLFLAIRLGHLGGKIVYGN